MVIRAQHQSIFSGLSDEECLNTGAYFVHSAAGNKHRVWLARTIKEGAPLRPAVFCLHNPSTAGHTEEDATSRRGASFAEALGCTHMVFINPASRCATDALDLPHVGLTCPENVAAIERALDIVRRTEGLFIMAGGLPKGNYRVRERMAELIASVDTTARLKGVVPMALRLTKTGWPEHPLYLPKSLTPTPYNRPAQWNG